MSVIPAAAQIETAADEMPSAFRAAQTSELMAFGATRAQSVGASGLSSDFQLGYELGLQTARVMIETNPLVQQFNIDPGQIL